jgi:hypothetical protein
VPAPAGTVRFKRFLADLLRTATKPNGGGEMDINDGWRAKLGVVTQRPGARLMLRMNRLVSPIQVLVIHYLKSYYDNWANSTAMHNECVERRKATTVATTKVFHHVDIRGLS